MALPLANALSDAVEAIKQDRCVPAPVGCGRPAVFFRDPATLRQYRTTGLCMCCQDKIRRAVQTEMEL